MKHDQTKNNVYVTADQLNRWLDKHADADWENGYFLDNTHYDMIAEEIDAVITENFTMNDGEPVITEDEVLDAKTSANETPNEYIQDFTDAINDFIHERLFG